jgi:hypothetical protein
LLPDALAYVENVSNNLLTIRNWEDYGKIEAINSAAPQSECRSQPKGNPGEAMVKSHTIAVACPDCGQRGQYSKRENYDQGEHSLIETAEKCKRNLDPLSCRVLLDEFSKARKKMR